MKTTKKNIVNFVKETEGELNFVVMAFDKKTGKRDLSYGGRELLSAFCEMTIKLRQGFDVILTDKTGWDYMFRKEMDTNTRVNYEEMLPYAVSFNSYSWEKNESSAVRGY